MRAYSFIYTCLCASARRERSVCIFFNIIYECIYLYQTILCFGRDVLQPSPDVRFIGFARWKTMFLTADILGDTERLLDATCTQGTTREPVGGKIVKKREKIIVWETFAVMWIFHLKILDENDRKIFSLFRKNWILEKLCVNN